MIDLTLLDSFKIMILKIINPFLPKLELKVDVLETITTTITEIYNTQLLNLSPSEISNLKTFLKQENFIQSYIYIFHDSFSKILKDNKINKDDIVHIIELVKNVIIQINQTNSNYTTQVNIDVKTIMILVKFIVTTVSMIITKNDKDMLPLINSIFSIVEISLLPISSKSCKCF